MTDGAWEISPTCPTGWPELLERCGGGLFHSPPGLALGAPRGTALFARYCSPDGTVGLAAGVRSRCRLTFQPRHVYLPTLPVVPGDGDAALHVLAELFRDDGAVELVIDAFDARWAPGVLDGAQPTRERHEYVVALDAGLEELASRFTRHHRRSLRRGLRGNWSLRTHHGREARDLLRVVQHSAAQRAAERRDPLMVDPPPAAGTLGADPRWGAATIAAWDRDRLLAAALVGWANRRAFFMRGGSTPAGYQANAAVWLHWRIMGELHARGFTAYNLGGAPATAARPEDPAHGIHRFKRDFGAQLRPCRGLRWTMSPAHERAHRAARGAVAHAVRAVP
jgi:hypothetical protein